MIIFRQKLYSKKNKKWTEEDYESYAESRAKDYEKDLDRNLKWHRGMSYGLSAVAGGTLGVAVGALGKKGSGKKGLIGGAIGSTVGAGLTATGRKIKKSKEKEEAAKKELVSEYKDLTKKEIRAEVKGDIKKANDFQVRTRDYREAAKPTDPNDYSQQEKNRRLMLRLTGNKQVYGRDYDI